MDLQNSLQDVIRCAMCETPVPPLYCEVCHINFARLVLENISEMNPNVTQWFQSNTENLFLKLDILNAKFIPKNDEISSVNNVTFLFVCDAFLPRNMRLTIQKTFQSFWREKMKPYKKIQKSQENVFILFIKRSHHLYQFREQI